MTPMRMIGSNPSQQYIPGIGNRTYDYTSHVSHQEKNLPPVRLAYGVATPEATFIGEVRLLVAQMIGQKLALYLDELAAKAEMPVARTVVAPHTFLSDGKTRIFVRQYISCRPEAVVEYADASSDEIDAWIDNLPISERCYFDDDITVDIYWA